MSFSWPSFPSVKPATTNSFAEALKRLAEHVEQKSKNAEANGSPVQSLVDIPNRMLASNMNSSMTSEQALRLYTQYIHEMERREDMRRCYLRAYGGSDGTGSHPATLNRRLDINDPYRFLPPPAPSLLYPSAYLQSFLQQTRTIPSSLFVANTVDAVSRMPTKDILDQKSELPSRPSKPKSKLFRPYDLDDSPCSPTTTTDDPQATTSSSSGKEKQLLNSLGLVQQSVDVQKSSSPSPIIDPIKDDTPTAIISNTLEDQHDEKLEKSSSSLKRKSTFLSGVKILSHRKQSKIEGHSKVQ